MEFTLRKYQPDDAQAFFALGSDARIKANMREGFCTSFDACQALMIDFSAQDESRQLCRAIIVDGKLAGSVGIFKQEGAFEKSAEVAYWVGVEYWGNGIACRAVEQICQLAFAKWDIVRVFAEPYAHNAPSRRVLEKAGFVLEGTLQKALYRNGSLYDYCIYALVK